MRQDRQANAAPAALDFNIRPQPKRRVRFAVSVFFGILTATFIALWVRSYWQADSLLTAANYNASIRSANGHLRMICMKYEMKRYGWGDSGWRFHSEVLQEAETGFEWKNTPGKLYIHLPYVCFVPLLGFISALPWVSCRFSLRTLLIATTLVAFVFGYAGWMVR